MKEGFWLNYRTRHFVELLCTGVDHEVAIRSPSSHEWLGVPASVATTFGKYEPRTDREAFLRHVMAALPLMRIRGHSTHVSVEFHARTLSKPFEAIGKWTGRFITPTMTLSVTNLATGDHWQVVAGEWAAFVRSRQR